MMNIIANQQLNMLQKVIGYPTRYVLSLREVRTCEMNFALKILFLKNDEWCLFYSLESLSYGSMLHA